MDCVPRTRHRRYSITVAGMEKKNAPACNADQSARTAPSYPNPHSQAGRFIAALLTGQKIDPLAGWFKLGIYRLSDTKLQLRRLGWPVTNLGLTVKNRFGDDCHVALYALPHKAINVAGWAGEAFSEWVAMQRRKETP